MRRLPFDICRCRDYRCPQRDSCARYRDRETGHERTPFAWTMREAGGVCHEKITYPPESDDHD